MAEPLVYPFNGMTVGALPVCLEPVEFVTFAAAYHPEWIGEDGMPVVAQVVLGHWDADALGRPEAEGAILVTLRPDIDGNESWVQAAKAASTRYPYDPQTRERFEHLAKLFEESDVDKT